MPRWAERAGPARASAGFTLLELVIVIILVIVLFSVAAWRLLPLRGQAEAAHVAATIGAMRSALGLAVAERVVRDGPTSVADLTGSNPVDLLDEPPAQYLGPRSQAEPRESPGGFWYFDDESGELVYQVQYVRYLHQAPEAPVRLRWEISVDTGPAGQLRGVRLDRLDSVRWQSEPLPPT